MKRYWFTIVLALVLGGLAAYVFYVDLPEERSRALQAEKAGRVLPFDEREITFLGVRSAEADVSLERSVERKWRITTPIRAEADTREVEALLRALALGKVSRVVEEDPTDLAPFGLEEPAVVLTIGANGRREVISLGGSGPLTATLYAMRGTNRNVLLTSLAPKDFLNKRVMTFRRKEILQFERAKVQRIRLTYPQRQLVLYRVDQGGKASWRIRSPIKADADQTEVRGLLFTLGELKALDFIDPGPKYDAVMKTLDAPEATVTLRVAGKDHVLKLFQPDPATGEGFAVSPRQDPIYRIPPTAIKDLTKNLFAIRDKRLLGMDIQDLAVLDVKTRETRYTLVQEDDAWVLEDQPHERLNPETVNVFVSRVVSLPAELQVLKRMGPLAPYGLASPTAVFTATDTRGKVSRVALGKRTSGLVYATGTGLRGLYQARADLLDQIPSKSELLGNAVQSSGKGS